MKPGKRAVGTVFQRGNTGRWMVRVTLPDGKRVERSIPVGTPDPRAAAEKLLAQLLTTPDLTPAGPHTLATWLDEYLARNNRDKAPATVRDRRYIADGIKAGLGRTRLDKLTPAMIQRWIDAPDTSHRARTKSLQMLRSALNEAVALGHLPRNVATPVRLPRQASRNVGVSWTQEQARMFLAANEGTTQYLLWRLALQTGARIGELLALRVSDFDAAAATLRIERTVSLDAETGTRKGVGRTKTEAGTRTFRLPPDAVETIRAQLEQASRQREKAGPQWQEQGWLFPSEVGTMLGYDNARRAWRVARARADVPPIRTHDLRVTFISLALRRGVKPEVVARMVGHSSPLITLRIYRQVFEDELDETREMLSGLI